MTFYKWSQTAAADATADASINWQEGQAPSSINDSARAMMAALAKYRDDLAGGIVSGGTSTAFAVSSYQGFDSLTRLNGQAIAFVPHATNDAIVTLNVDGLGAKPLRSAPMTELLAGMLVQGTPYTCTYNHADAAFYLRDFHVSPYSVPLGACIDYFGAAAPSSAFALAFGQAISRSAYAGLFSLFGTTYGTGDGSSTFNIPDLRGRVCAGKDDMGGNAASRLTSAYFGVSTSLLGAVGGGENKVLLTANLPAYTPSGTITNGAISATVSGAQAYGGTAVGGGGASGLTAAGSPGAISFSQSSSSFSGNPQGGTSAPFAVIQPTIIANKLIRIV